MIPGRPRAIVTLLLAGCLLAVAAQAAAVEPPPIDPLPSGVDAWFTFSPGSPRAGETVTFQSESDAYGPGNQITNREWDLDGDGTFETTGPATVSRSYPTSGTIEVTLRVTDASQPANTDTATRKVRVTNRAPVASFRWSPTEPRANEPVNFTSTASDPDGTLTEQVWDLNGDGNFDNGGGATALRAFPAPGSYAIGLRVTDNRGSVSFSSQTVTVAPDPLTGPVGAVRVNGARLMSPFPIVRVAGRILPNGSRIRLLVVSAPRGAKVSIRCHGRGCPFKKQVRVSRKVRVRKLERLLRAGVTVKVYVTRPGTIGKFTRLRIRAGKAPARKDLCLAPRSWRPIRCPGG